MLIAVETNPGEDGPREWFVTIGRAHSVQVDAHRYPGEPGERGGLARAETTAERWFTGTTASVQDALAAIEEDEA